MPGLAAGVAIHEPARRFTFSITHHHTDGAVKLPVVIPVYNERANSPVRKDGVRALQLVMTDVNQERTGPKPASSANH
jgi:hypothetical protein